MSRESSNVAREIVARRFIVERMPSRRTQRKMSTTPSAQRTTSRHAVPRRVTSPYPGTLSSCRVPVSGTQTVDSLCHPLVRFDMRQSRSVRSLFLILLSMVILSPLGAEVTRTQQRRKPFVPVTDAMLQNPAPADWLMWRRTLNSWGYSPLDQINRDNVGDLRMIWTRALRPGSQQGTPLAYGGVLYMPNPKDIIQAIDVASGDLIWEHQRDLPNDVWNHVGGYLAENNRNIAIHGTYIIDTSVDDHVFAIDL